MKLIAGTSGIAVLLVAYRLYAVAHVERTRDLMRTVRSTELSMPERRLDATFRR